MKGRGKGLKGVTGQRHPRAKLTDARRARLLALYDEGWTPTELAKRYNVSVEYACRIGKRRVRT